jgi:hypothetical protein
MATPQAKGGGAPRAHRTAVHTTTSPATANGPDPNRVLELYRECVDSGIWARVVMETKRGGNTSHCPSGDQQRQSVQLLQP